MIHQHVSPLIACIEMHGPCPPDMQCSASRNSPQICEAECFLVHGHRCIRDGSFKLGWDGALDTKMLMNVGFKRWKNFCILNIDSKFIIVHLTPVPKLLN